MATNMRVTCTADAGAPFGVTWVYDAGDPYGHFDITFVDRTHWLTTAAARFYNPGTGRASNLYYALGQIEDRMGTAINLNYGGAGPSGFPLLTSITDASTGSALLTLTRATDGTGNLVAAADGYGRSVYYHVGSYAAQDVPPGYPTTYGEVDMVSQIVPTGTASPANRTRRRFHASPIHKSHTPRARAEARERTREAANRPAPG